MLRAILSAAFLASAVLPANAVGLYCLHLKTVPWVYRMEPTVPYRAYTIPSALLNAKYCSDPNGGEVVGCAYPRTDDPSRWIIVIADTVSAVDYPCVLAYEKSHLPPNCWGDASFEHPGAMDYLQTSCSSN